jgi:heterodisulfide reductase subunit B
MRYAYYPGCSLESTAKGYDLSLRAVFRLLGQELEEIDDWNCCGATAYMSVAETVALAVSARNLALAERMGGLDVVAPCSACFTVLSKTQRYLRGHSELRDRVQESLAEAGLSLTRPVRVRHPLDVLVNDVGLDAVVARAARHLGGAKVAPYYGCQIVRPERGFDDREVPMWLDVLFQRLGAEVVDYPPKVRCCGGMQMSTNEQVGLRLNFDLLAEAMDSGANVVVTTCPLCQINLEAYQTRINDTFGTAFKIPVVYFTQLLGLALGFSPEEMLMDQLILPLQGAARGAREVHA